MHAATCLVLRFSNFLRCEYHACDCPQRWPDPCDVKMEKFDDSIQNLGVLSVLYSPHQLMQYQRTCMEPAKGARIHRDATDDLGFRESRPQHRVKAFPSCG